MAVSAGVVLASAALLAGVAGPPSLGSRRRERRDHRQDSKAWSFGVMADTQWIGADDGRNPNSVAVDIIRQLNASPNTLFMWRCS